MYQYVFPIMTFLYRRVPMYRFIGLCRFFAYLQHLYSTGNLWPVARPVFSRLINYYVSGSPSNVGALVHVDMSGVVLDGSYTDLDTAAYEDRLTCLPSKGRPWLPGSENAQFDASRCASAPLVGSGVELVHRCVARYGPCQRFLGSVPESRDVPPLVPFVLLQHVLRYHAYLGANDYAYLLFFLEASDFVSLVCEYLVPILQK